ncbi:DUF2147 domain-containing protein [Emticicia sp. TH156]|uniref:DUF2147 domain-containing protein n=1 Tax=Emticicia sp. TH156 TaxID=2067454 RepID=UPI0013043449|nr:DUF2147 domain-containing protein [Emticicia sp. TH156]
MKTLFYTSLLLVNIYAIHSKPDDLQANKIIGIWLSADKDLKVEIFKRNAHYFGKVVWFWCDSKTPDMNSFKDTENPDTRLRDRKWLGMEVVESLTYKQYGEWNNGTIYDPNTGRKYSSVVRLKTRDTLIVRGYWGIELLGKNLEFHRVN